MESDKPARDDPAAASDDPLQDDHQGHAKSVTDLIDRIERTAFKRQVASRVVRAHFAWRADGQPNG